MVHRVIVEGSAIALRVGMCRGYKRIFSESDSPNSEQDWYHPDSSPQCRQLRRQRLSASSLNTTGQEKSDAAKKLLAVDVFQSRTCARTDKQIHKQVARHTLHTYDIYVRHLNSFRGIACEGHADTHTDTDSSIWTFSKFVRLWKWKLRNKACVCSWHFFIYLSVYLLDVHTDR